MSESPVPLSEDQRFAAEAIHDAMLLGLNVEIGYVTSTQTNQREYYAMTIPYSLQDQIIKQTMAPLVAENAATAKPGAPKRPLNITVPIDRLLWQDFIAQPTYVAGHPSREAAIKASLIAYEEAWLAGFFDQQESTRAKVGLGQRALHGTLEGQHQGARHNRLKGRGPKVRN